MRTLISRSVFVSLLIFTIFAGQLYAQSFKKMDDVKYLQLPTEQANHDYVEIFVKSDESETRDALSFGLSKLTGAKEGSKAADIMDGFVKEIFADQVEKYDTWYLYDGNISAPEGSTTLKAVITYKPDDSARPMGTPMKGSKNGYAFSYRVNAVMRIYDGDEMVKEVDFGAISGTGHSETWPETTGNAGDMFSVKVTEEDEPSERHPYEVACIDGAIQQTLRVVYGLYGIKEFEVPLQVAVIKKQKESKDYFKKYKEIMEGKKSFLLSKTATAEMQSCVDYWESILSSTKEEYLWAVHHNLAVGYGWLLNADKSREHIRAFYDLKKDVFEKIKNKSGSFNHKDLAVVEAYNQIQPFAEYFAEGVTQHMDWIELLSMDLNSIAEVTAINYMIAEMLDIPIPVPVFPVEHHEMGMKKCEGLIYKNDQEILEFEYKIKKGILEEMKYKGRKNTITDDYKGSLHYRTQSSKESREKNRISKNFGPTGIRSRFALTSEQKIEIHSLDINSKKVWKPFRFENEEVTGGRLDSQRMSSIRVDYGEYDIPENMDYSANTWCKNEFTWGEGIRVSLSAEDTRTYFVAQNPDENGIPSGFKVTWKFDDLTIHVNKKIKYKFAEETYTEQRRQDAANREARPATIEKIRAAIEADNGTFVKDDNKYDVEVSYEYPFSMKTDDKGNWIEMQIGDYKITREIKY